MSRSIPTSKRNPVSPTRYFLFLSVLLLVSALVIWATPVDEERSEILVSPDPSFETLRIRYMGGSTNLNTSLRLFADGRLLVEKVGPDDTVFESEELSISPERIEAILDDIVLCGLMEFDEEAMRTKMGSKTRRTTISDGSTMFVSIRLQKYRPAGHDRFEPAERHVTLANPSQAARHHPEIEEIQCLGRLDQLVRTYQRLARRSADAKQK